MTPIASGDRFGLLVALIEIDAPGKRKRECRCDCGNVAIVEETKLRTGHTKSCGCLRKTGPHLIAAAKSAVKANMKSIIGMRFGRLVVLESAGRLKVGDELVQCVCDCGKIVIKNRHSLVDRSTKSCGCAARDHGKVMANERARKLRKLAGLPENIPMSDVNRTLRNSFREISATIKKRDDFTCVICRLRGVRLNVHHIESWARNVEKRFDQTNLVTLCHPCHIHKAHRGNVHSAPDDGVAQMLRQHVDSIC